MADIQVEGNWLVDPSNAIKIKWIEVQIQERKSRIIRHRQDMEDLIKGKMVDLEARILVLDQELKQLEADKAKLVIDVVSEVKGG